MEKEGGIWRYDAAGKVEQEWVPELLLAAGGGRMASGGTTQLQPSVVLADFFNREVR